MSDFIVSARKYRPQRFDEVVGQEATTQTLKHAIQSQHLAHSYLFCGSRGVGKTTIARILAKTINCKNLQPDGEACNTCDSCVSFNKNASFNIHELDAASKNSVDDIRALVEQVMYPPQNAQYKIFIIDEVHMLSQSAFNAFLKTLEEPPSYAKFILATTEKHKILPTILSRCQIYDFKRIQVVDIKNHLQKIAEKEGIQAEDSALHLIAVKADGGLRDALSMFDRLASMHEGALTYQDVLSNLNILDYDYYFQIVNAIVQENDSDLLLMLDTIIAKGFDMDVFLSGLSEHIRNLWMAKKDTTLQLVEFADDVKNRFIEQSKNIPESILLNLLQIISDCEVALKTTRNRRLQVELALLKMCYVHRLINSSWTAMDEKKKLTPSNPSKPTSTVSVEPHNTPPVESKSMNTGILLEELVNKVAKKEEALKQLIEESQKSVTDMPSLWTMLQNSYEGTQVIRDFVMSLTPIIVDHRFIFKVGDITRGGMIEKLFPQFQKLSKVHSALEVTFHCQMDEELSHKEDLSLKERFDEMAIRYPILHQLREDFKLDFNT